MKKPSIERILPESDDLLVVNAARVSFAKEKKEFDASDKKGSDKNLLNYLAEHHHIAPFFHPTYHVCYSCSMSSVIDRFPAINAGGGRIMTHVDKNTGVVDVIEFGSLYHFFRFPLNPVLDEHLEKSAPYAYAALKKHIGRTYIASGKLFQFGVTDIDTVKIAEDLRTAELSNNGRIEPGTLEGYSEILAFIPVTLRIGMSISQARQWFRSNVGFCRNEVSRRYVSGDPEFIVTENRAASTKGAKQGSSDFLIDAPGPTKEQICSVALQNYKNYIQAGVAPECARDILPVMYYTEFIETGNLISYARLYSLRSEEHTQKENRETADLLDGVLRREFGYLWEIAKSMFDRGVPNYVKPEKD